MNRLKDWSGTAFLEATRYFLIGRAFTRTNPISGAPHPCVGPYTTKWPALSSPWRTCVYKGRPPCFGNRQQGNFHDRCPRETFAGSGAIPLWGARKCRL